MKRGPDWKRGRHKKAVSRETRAWEAGHLIPPPPPWMPSQTYRNLALLRTSL